MRDYFNEEIFKGFGNVVYRKYGNVLVELYNKDEDKGIRCLVYDLSENEIDKLSMEERTKHVILDKSYDISDVNFSNEMSVVGKLSNLILTFEAEVFSE